MYQRIIKPVLFSLTIERAHRAVLLLLRCIGLIPGGRWLLRKCYAEAHPSLEREAFLCEHLWELDEIPSSEGIRTERWKYMRYRFIPGREELYDLAADSEEAVNLASDPAYGRTLEELRRECNRQIERYVSLRRH